MIIIMFFNMLLVNFIFIVMAKNQELSVYPSTPKWGSK